VEVDKRKNAEGSMGILRDETGDGVRGQAPAKPIAFPFP